MSFAPTSIPEPELAEQVKETLATFIRFSDLWLDKVPYRPDSSAGRKFKNRMWNANIVSKQMLARLNDEIVEKWEFNKDIQISASG